MVVGPSRAHAIQKFSLYALFFFIRQVSIRYVLRLGLNPTAYTVPQWDSVSRERRHGATALSYGGLVSSRFGEAVSTPRRTNFRAQFHDLL